MTRPPHVLLVLVLATRGATAARAAEVQTAPLVAIPAAGEPTDEAAAGGSPAAEVACGTSSECAARFGHGNVCREGRCAEYFDRRDVYGLFGLRTAAPPTPQRLDPLVAAVPAIGYSPSSGVLIGFAGTMGMLLGDPSDTRMSNATGSFLYTTKNQVILSLAATAVTAGNRWELLSDWRYLIFNQDTYGLGSGVPPLATGVSLGGLGNLAAVPGAQPMNFDLLRFHQSVLRHVTGDIYLGLGYRLDRYSKIVDHRLDLSASPPVVTSHYAYSQLHGFDPAAYTASGLSVEVLSDSRDSTIAPYRGWYGHLKFTDYPTWLGSTQSSTLFSGEGRAYVGLSEEDPRNLLAFWVMASAVTSGRLPYLALPASGWDARSSTGRGYVQGRFRGTAQAYAEVEWRFRLTEDGLLGGTVFANAQTYARPSASLPAYGYTEAGEDLFDTIRPAGGVGLRLMLLKQSRTALRVDVAGGEGSITFYLGAGEAF